MARPTKFTPEVTETILKAIQIGATYKDAAEAAGVSFDTFNEWMKAGREGSKKFSEFFELIRKAEAQARLNYLSTIAQAAAKGDWKAAEAYLKRRDRANWGDNVDVTTGGEKITIEVEYVQNKDTTA
jgi:transposase